MYLAISSSNSQERCQKGIVIGDGTDNIECPVMRIWVAVEAELLQASLFLTHFPEKTLLNFELNALNCDACSQLIVQHYKVYYPVRHHLIQHIVNSVQKLGLTPNVSLRLMCHLATLRRELITKRCSVMKMVDGSFFINYVLNHYQVPSCIS